MEVTQPPEEHPQFNPLEVENVLRGRVSEDAQSGWSIISFQHESTTEHRWFEYRDLNGNYTGCIRYVDGVGWYAYKSGEGLVETKDPETGELRPALFGTTLDPTEAAGHIDGRAVATVQSTEEPAEEIIIDLTESAEPVGSAEVIEMRKLYRPKMRAVVGALAALALVRPRR